MQLAKQTLSPFIWLSDNWAYALGAVTGVILAVAEIVWVFAKCIIVAGVVLTLAIVIGVAWVDITLLRAILLEVPQDGIRFVVRAIGIAAMIGGFTMAPWEYHKRIKIHAGRLRE